MTVQIRIPESKGHSVTTCRRLLSFGWVSPSIYEFKRWLRWFNLVEWIVERLHGVGLIGIWWEYIIGLGFFGKWEIVGVYFGIRDCEIDLIAYRLEFLLTFRFANAGFNLICCQEIQLFWVKFCEYS